jgi:PhnB protein
VRHDHYNQEQIMSTVKPIPDGYRTVTPYLTIKGASEAIEFYKKAFGAEETARMPGPDGRLMHAEIKIGECIVMMSDEFPEYGPKGSPSSLGGTTAGILLYVPDADAAWNKAVAAGAQVVMPLDNAFWGDRYGKLKDPFGHEWSIATHIEDLTPEEMEKRMKASFAPPSK